MAVNKFVKFAAPYTSKTFNETHRRMMGANGVLSGGKITVSGGIATIQPIKIVQQGGITDITNSLSAVMPTQMEAPYFMALSVSTMVENVSEVITPTFVKRPEDITDTMVLISQWDGDEWIPLPHLGSSDIVSEVADARIAGGIVGVMDGFFSTEAGGILTTQPGRAVTKDGVLFKKIRSSSFNIPPADALASLPQDSTSDRIDTLVLRKIMDSGPRPAYLKYLVGTWGGPEAATFPTIDSTLAITPGADNVVKIIGSNTQGNPIYVAREGIGVGSQLLVGTEVLGTGTGGQALALADVEAFDSILNPDSSVDTVYIKTNDLYYARFDISGTIIFNETLIYTSSTPLANPKLVSIQTGGTYQLHIVVEKEISGFQRQLIYMRRSAGNSEETQPQVWVDLSANLANPSLEKDDEDTLLYLAFENQTTGAAFLRTYDASTATFGAAPTMIGTPIELQDDTVFGLTTLSPTGASKPIVKRSGSKELYVFWKHFVGSGEYLLSVYNSGYMDKYGHKAVALGATVSDPNILDYDVLVDECDYVHTIICGENFNTRLMSFKGLYPVESTERYEGQNLLAASSASFSLSILKSSTGSLVVAYINGDDDMDSIHRVAAVMTGTKSSPVIAEYDVVISQYSSFDNEVYNRGTYIEESTPVARLYEQNNLFASTGSVTWDNTTNTLAINDPIILKMVNKYAEYLIPIGNVSIPDGHVLTVAIPDGDVFGQVTPPYVLERMGDVTLDRTRRTYYPLFWAFDNVLYSRFAPFRVSEGEVIIGEGLSQKAKQWLGLPSSSPDPNNHNYSSTNFINQNDDYNTALGKLDYAIAGAAGGAIKVRLIDVDSTTLPTGTVVIDGVTVNAGDMVLFANLNTGNNQVYSASGTGTNITGWTAEDVFEGPSITPKNGSLVYIQEGDIYTENFLYFNATDWKNLLNNKFSQQLLDNKTNEPFMYLDKNQIEDLTMEYSIKRGTNKKVALLFATQDGTDVEIDEFEIRRGDVGITFDGVILGNYIVLRYTSTNIGIDATFQRTIRVW